MSLRNTVVFLSGCFLILHQSNKLNAVDPCIYDSGAKGVIDLTSIGRVDGTPTWKSITPETSDGHVYSHNPCHSFSQSSCTDVAACQIYATDEKLAYSLGTQDTVQWRTTIGQEVPTLVYGTSDRTLIVDLRCLNSKEPNKLDVHGYDPQTQLYTMTLSSQCVCWDGCKGGSRPQTNNGLSRGTIFIIILVVLAVVYLIVFVSFNKLKRQATGVDLIPHRTFWMSLPVYSYNGVLFVFRKATNKKTDYTAVA